MTFLEQLREAQKQNNSLLCVGLDPLPQRLPAGVGLLDFCMKIVEATADIACAYKPQIAYFAAQRAESELEKLITAIRLIAPNIPIILDAKRGDIGSTAEQYALEAFERYGADAVTLSPFMGYDSIEPYLHYPDKGAFLLCRTSNAGGADLQNHRLADVDGQPSVFEHIARLAQGPWNTNGQLGLVVGATWPEEIARVRAIAPRLPLLIPGIGTQGGDPEAAVRAGWRPGGPIIVNSSRAILYASSGADFADAARTVAERARDRLNEASDLVPGTRF